MGWERGCKMIEVLEGDCQEVMKTLADNSVDSMVTDPPYGISFMGKKWDYEIPSVEVWAEALRVLKPGAHALIACGTRTQHRMVCNIEDAGFEIRDVVTWMYGSGFPKSMNVSKAVDKINGNEREFIQQVKRTGKESGSLGAFAGNNIETKGTSEWEGWGTALKPSTEYFTLAQKPLDSRSDMCYVDCIKEIIKCLLQSLAKTAVNNSTSSQQEPNGDAVIVRWPVGKSINTLEDLQGVMDTLRCYIEENTNLNIVLSWLNTLGEIWSIPSTPTTKTELNLTTELKILRSLEWESILANIMLVNENPTNGLSASALDAISLFSVVRLKLKHIQTRSAQESASSVQLDPDTNSTLFTLCRKPISERTVASNVLKWGVGGINIDGCRVGDEKVSTHSRGSNTASPSRPTETKVEDSGRKTRQDGIDMSERVGRFPANLILTYPEDEYILRDDVTADQLYKLAEWMNENT